MTSRLSFTVARGFARHLGFTLHREVGESEVAVYVAGTPRHGDCTYYAGDWQDACNHVAFVATLPTAPAVTVPPYLAAQYLAILAGA